MAIRRPGFPLKLKMTTNKTRRSPHGQSTVHYAYGAPYYSPDAHQRSELWFSCDQDAQSQLVGWLGEAGVKFMWNVDGRGRAPDVSMANDFSLWPKASVAIRCTRLPMGQSKRTSVVRQWTGIENHMISEAGCAWKFLSRTHSVLNLSVLQAWEDRGSAPWAWREC